MLLQRINKEVLRLAEYSFQLLVPPLLVHFSIFRTYVFTVFCYKRHSFDLKKLNRAEKQKKQLLQSL